MYYSVNVNVPRIEQHNKEWPWTGRDSYASSSGWSYYKSYTEAKDAICCRAGRKVSDLIDLLGEAKRTLDTLMALPDEPAPAPGEAG